MLAQGLTLTLYEARETVSKYITVTDGKLRFRVRFSNHRPHVQREMKKDCDVFVGVSHSGCVNTAEAIRATLAHFGKGGLSV